MMKRDRLEIIHSILAMTSESKEELQTHIMYKCNLSYDWAKAYLSHLIEKGLLEIKGKTPYKIQEGKIYYIAPIYRTQKGTEAYIILKECLEKLKEVGLI